MTPKEKADWLVDRFSSHASAGNTNSHIIKRFNAKVCALIVVKETLAVIGKIDEEVIKRKDEYRLIDEYSYWMDVKEQIELL